MAGHGPAPRRTRQRKQSPARGDWKQLEPLAEYILPELDEIPPPSICEGEWPYTSRLYWEAWRESPVTAIWTQDDQALAVDTICGHAEAVSGGRGLPPSEVRLRQESLGLTPKGRKDNRLLLPNEAEEADLHALPAREQQDTPAQHDRVIPEAI